MERTAFKTLFTAFVFASVAALFAQDIFRIEKKTAEELANIETETMAAQLDQPLSSEQLMKIKEINLDFHAKKKEAKDRKTTGEEFKILYKNREDSIQLILSPEQFRSWENNPIAKKVRERANQEEMNQKNNP